MGTDVDIREARPDDRDAVFEFVREADEEEEERDYVPDVWDDWVEDETEGAVLVADAGEPVGVLRVTTFPTDEAWLEGMRVDPDRRREGVATALVEEALESVDADVARLMVFGWNDAGVELLETSPFERVAAFRYARGFGFPYGTQIQDATFDESLEALRGTDAYDAMGGLYATTDWRMRRIPATVQGLDEGTEVLAVDDDGVRSILVCDGTRVNTTAVEDRTELVLGFVWCEREYAGQVALDVRAEARERNLNDALVFLPDDSDYTAAFDEAGFDVSDEAYVYELEL